jgi:hypothetical protein
VSPPTLLPTSPPSCSPEAGHQPCPSQRTTPPTTRVSVDLSVGALDDYVYAIVRSCVWFAAFSTGVKHSRKVEQYECVLCLRVCVVDILNLVLTFHGKHNTRLTHFTAIRACRPQGSPERFEEAAYIQERVAQGGTFHAMSR